MQQKDLIETLEKSYKDLNLMLLKYTKDELEFSLPGKWSAAQQAQHLHKSVRPVKFAFQLPQFLLKALFGKANRASKSYDELLKKYHAQLSKGGSASAPFVPAKVENIHIDNVIIAIEKNIKSLAQSIEKKTEEDLDLCLLPHPLLGKVTLREMLYFTIFHVLHHRENITNQLTRMNDFKAEMFNSKK